jgi:hypothetical protein
LAWISDGTVAGMRGLVAVLAIVVWLAGCAAGEIGEVDHSCHVNPYDELGSGCAHIRPRAARLPGHPSHR